jgi:hypothetical protein
MHHPSFSAEVGIIVPATCDAGVRAALLRVIDNLTKQHSISSRRHSIAALVRRELDAEMARVITEFDGDWNRGWLKDFRPSRMWTPAPERPWEVGDDYSSAASDTVADQALRCARE